MRKAKSYHEPWHARQRTIPGPIPFADGPPAELDPEAVDRIVSTHARLVAEADWLIWGSAMIEPYEAAMPLSPGELAPMDDRMIVATVRRLVGRGDHGSLARRAVECVNACAGIDNPEELISGVMELLRDLACCEADNRDARVLALLSRFNKE